MKNITISSFASATQNVLNTAYPRAFSRKGYNVNILPSLVPILSEDLDDLREEFIERAASVAEKNDILVLSGGQDVNPVSMGRLNYNSVGTSINRDLWEGALLKAFVEKEKPIMGICRGFQFIGQQIGVENFTQNLGQCKEHHNGGDLDVKERYEPVHNLFLLGSFEQYYGKKLISVNSFHHQGFCFSAEIKNAKQNIADCVTSHKKNKIDILATTNCVVEAFQTKNIFGVQWHPEEYGNNGKTIQYFLDKVC